MPKEAKIKQTDWTTGGRDISNTAIPLYQEGLGQLGDYMNNVQNRLDPYLENYIDLAQASQKNDLIRSFYDAASKTTANNYNAMNGGYSSANQGTYDDVQRYYNDLASRLYTQGLEAANTMANNEYNMLTGALNSYRNAYNLGERYSAIDQYNDMVDQANDNMWTGVVNTLGDIGMSIPNPWAQAIGAGLKTVGTAFGKDFGAMDNLRAAATGATGGQYQGDDYSGWGKSMSKYLGGLDWSKLTGKSSSTGSGAGFGNFMNFGNSGLGSYGLNTTQSAPTWKGFGG